MYICKKKAMEIFDTGTHLVFQEDSEIIDAIPKPIRIIRHNDSLVFIGPNSSNSAGMGIPKKVEISVITIPSFVSHNDLINQLIAWSGSSAIEVCSEKSFGDAVWENISSQDYIRTQGYSKLGIYIDQKYDSVTNPKIRVMAMNSEDPTDQFILDNTDKYVKDLFLQDTKICFEYTLDGVIPFVQIQSYSDDKGSAGDYLNVKIVLK